MAKVTRRSNGALKRMMSADGMRQITAALEAAGQQIEKDAEISITKGSAGFGRHVPSKPGEPPNADTGGLDGSIETNIVGPGKVEVSANIEYAAHLEFGTSKMAARPYMRPAAEANREHVRELVGQALRKIVRGGTVTS